MTIEYSKHFNTKETSQKQPIPGKNQSKNAAGGYTFDVSEFTRLDRFLILGSEGGSYYATEKKLTADNAQAVLALIKKDGVGVVNRVVEISDAGRAPKNDPALFVLAMALKLGDEATRRAAREALPKVARIGTHLFHFAQYVEAFGGWGRGTRRAFADWYLGKSVSSLAEQVVKYASRDGWSHADLIRLSHVSTRDAARNTILKYAGAPYAAAKSELDFSLEGLKILEGVEKIKTVKTAKEAVKLINEYKLPREVIPTELLNEKDVWEALLPHMKLTAVIRNLAKMTSIGLVGPLSAGTKLVVQKLQDEADLKKQRVHPIAVLSALRTYARGHGVRGSLTWTPVQAIADALDDAFYTTFVNVEPSNKDIVLALDISGSMGSGEIAGVPGLTPRDASAALALITASVEKNYVVLGFSHNLITLPITAKMRLDQVIKKISSLPFGGTDASLPVLYAEAQKIGVDAFVMYTDNETWAGRIHPSQALAKYRKTSGRNTKMVTVAMTATQSTITDPDDESMLDVVGFDTATPALISDFIK